MPYPARLLAALGILWTSQAQSQIDAPRVRIAEDLRLDASAEDFPAVTRVYVGPRGQIAVPIATDQQVRIYDTDGRKIAAFGRRGAGPGEFASISFLGWKGDSIWVQDLRQRRTTYIGADFKLLRTELWPGVDLQTTEPGRVGAFDPLALLPDGTWLGQGFITTSDRNRRQGALALRGADGSYRIVLRQLSDQDNPQLMLVAGFGRFVPFALQTQYAFPSDGSRFGELAAPLPASERSHFTVTVFRATGDTVFSRRYEFRGVPISRSAKDSALAAMLPRGGRVSEGPQDLPQRFQAIARDRMSNWYIPVETLTLGLDQTIWIGMRLTDAGRPYLILNGRGDPIGSVVLPRSSRVRQASATHIWVTETDDDGLTSVVRYRIEGLRCGAVPC
ncbi:MAG TPA: hypothetical protein VFZ73_15615 [Gemmatimonadaceae bacterium]